MSPRDNLFMLLWKLQVITAAQFWEARTYGVFADGSVS